MFPHSLLEGVANSSQIVCATSSGEHQNCGLAIPRAQSSAAQRLRCAPGMFNRLEVQVLYPT